MYTNAIIAGMGNFFFAIFIKSTLLYLADACVTNEYRASYCEIAPVL